MKVLSYFFIFFTMIQLEGGDDLEINDFLVMTIPKSGTHLIDKLMMMLTDRHQISAGTIADYKYGSWLFPGRDEGVELDSSVVERYFEKCKQKDCYSLSHTNFSVPFEIFCHKHPEYIKIIHIRDLRDVCVSAVFYYRSGLDTILGPFASFDHRLSFVIKLMSNRHRLVQSISKYAKEAVYWMKQQDVIVSRFEDLVGIQGGGDIDHQKALIRSIASSLNIDLDEDKFKDITNNLFGGTKTFRKGAIGSWKEYFKRNHKIEFKRADLGKLLIEMGYENDNNW